MAVAERSLLVPACPRPKSLRASDPPPVGLQLSALGLLEAIDLRARADDRAWFGQVAAAVRRVRDDLAVHVRTTEAREGFHNEIVRAAPRLVRQTQRLAEEHRAMEDRVALLGLLASSRALMSRGGVEEAMRSRAVELFELIRRHRQQGSDLVHEAYVADLGWAG